MKKITLLILIVMISQLNGSQTPEKSKKDGSILTQIKKITLLLGVSAAVKMLCVGALATYKTTQDNAKFDFENFKKLFKENLLWDSNNETLSKWQYVVSLIVGELCTYCRFRQNHQNIEEEKSEITRSEPEAGAEPGSEAQITGSGAEPKPEPKPGSESEREAGSEAQITGSGAELQSEPGSLSAAQKEKDETGGPGAEGTKPEPISEAESKIEEESESERGSVIISDQGGRKFTGNQGYGIIDEKESEENAAEAAEKLLQGAEEALQGAEEALQGAEKVEEAVKLEVENAEAVLKKDLTSLKKKLKEALKPDHLGKLAAEEKVKESLSAIEKTAEDKVNQVVTLAKKVLALKAGPEARSKVLKAANAIKQEIERAYEEKYIEEALQTLQGENITKALEELREAVKKAESLEKALKNASSEAFEELRAISKNGDLTFSKRPESEPEAGAGSKTENAAAQEAIKLLGQAEIEAEGSEAGSLRIGGLEQPPSEEEFDELISATPEQKLRAQVEEKITAAVQKLRAAVEKLAKLVSVYELGVEAALKAHAPAEALKKTADALEKAAEAVQVVPSEKESITKAAEALKTAAEEAVKVVALEKESITKAAEALKTAAAAFNAAAAALNTEEGLEKERILFKRAAEELKTAAAALEKVKESQEVISYIFFESNL